jgi:hypothetical protein
MAVEVKLRRGTANQHATFTGAIGEVTVDITNDTLRVHDGTLAGGHRLAKFSDIAAQSANLLSVTTNIVPSANVTYDLGTAELAWRDLYLSGNTITLGDKTISTDANTLTIQGNNGEPVRLVTDSIRIGNTNASTVLKASEAGKLITVDANTGAEQQTSFANVSITSLILENVLGTQYGGTGLTSYTPNGVLFAANSSALTQASGIVGQILQISADGTPTFDNLDGGDF